MFRIFLFYLRISKKHGELKTHAHIYNLFITFLEKGNSGKFSLQLASVWRENWRVTTEEPSGAEPPGNASFRLARVKSELYCCVIVFQWLARGTSGPDSKGEAVQMGRAIIYYGLLVGPNMGFFKDSG